MAHSRRPVDRPQERAARVERLAPLQRAAFRHEPPKRRDGRAAALQFSQKDGLPHLQSLRSGVGQGAASARRRRPAGLRRPFPHGSAVGGHRAPHRHAPRGVPERAHARDSDARKDPGTALLGNHRRSGLLDRDAANGFSRARGDRGRRQRLQSASSPAHVRAARHFGRLSQGPRSRRPAGGSSGNPPSHQSRTGRQTFRRPDAGRPLPHRGGLFRVGRPGSGNLPPPGRGAPSRGGWCQRK